MMGNCLGTSNFTQPVRSDDCSTVTSNAYHLFNEEATRCGVYEGIRELAAKTLPDPGRTSMCGAVLSG